MSASRSLARAFPRRALLSGTPRAQCRLISTKNSESPADRPIKPATEQAIPVGPYYESILIRPQPIPQEKPEEPPSTSPKAPPKTPAKRGRPRKNGGNPAENGVDNTKGKAGVPKEAAEVIPTKEPAAEAAYGPQIPSTPEDLMERAKKVFGSRLESDEQRAKRLAAIQRQSTLIGGVLVPPKPEEPDNCCMSGCVNCVWDRFRDELEEWAVASAEADKRLQAERGQGPVKSVDKIGAAQGVPPVGKSLPEPISMDDDGGGSETNWDVPSVKPDLKSVGEAKISKNLWDDELYRNVPVGIREFMKLQKKLKDKHVNDGKNEG